MSAPTSTVGADRSDDGRTERASLLLAERLRARAATRSDEQAALDDEDWTSRLSFAQQRMWFLHEMDPTSPEYHVTSVVRVVGDLDVEALRASYRCLIERHDVLRTGFTPGADGLPRRHREQAVEPDLVTVDLGGLGGDGQARACEDAVREHLLRPFDLALPPLIRTTVIRLAPQEHVLATAIHHVAVDGWSVGVLHRELGTVYSALINGNDPDLAPVRRTFDEFVRTEAAVVDGRRGEAGLAYWREQLADLTTVDLPMAKPRQADAGAVGSRIVRDVPDDVARRLEWIAGERGGSLYMVLLTAFTSLLNRYSSQRDIAVGSPVANRAQAGSEDLIGLVGNVAVLRLQPDPTRSFNDAVDDAKVVVLDALDHQETPFELVVEALNPERLLSVNPLFQVMFALQNHEADQIALDGLEVTALDADLDVCRFDLECTTWRTGDGLRLRFNFRPDLFDRSAVEVIADGFVALLGQVASDPAAALVDHDPFDGAPMSVMVGPHHETSPASTTVLELFEQAAARDPHAPAVSDPDVTSSFREVLARADSLAGRLRLAGVGPGDVVGLCLPRTVDLVASVIGVWKAGAAFVPLNPEDPADRLSFILDDVEATAVVVAVDGDTTPGLGSRRLVPARCLETTADPGGSPPQPDDIAYILYTSGTTGRPKGAVIRHSNLASTLLACQEEFAFDETDAGLVIAASTFDVFYYELFSCMLAGGSSRLVTQAELFDPTRITTILESASSFQAVPGVMEHLFAALDECGIGQIDRVRVAMTGGDLVPPALLRRIATVFPRATVAVTYGPTEAAIFATCHRADCSEPASGHPIGRPLAGVEIRVADEFGRPLPVGTTGEIWIGGLGVGEGYTKRPDETRERFVELGSTRFYRSGDRGRVSPVSGELSFLARQDTQVKVRGLRIELGEVEAALHGVDGVKAAVAAVAGESTSERRVVAYVVPDETHDLDLLDDGDRPAAVDAWRELFDRTHEEPDDDPHDFTGWNNSYDGSPLGAEAMTDWLDGTLAAIRERLAALGCDRPRVLELGCGTGLLLLELAGEVGRYDGVDFSETVLAGLHERVAEAGLENVGLHLADVGDLAGFDEYDVVVVNSVLQYLPDIGYAAEVLRGALDRLSDGGFLFVGDVRSLPLLASYHESIERFRDPGATDAEIAARTERAIVQEDELVIAPSFFVGLAGEVGGSQPDVEPRRGRVANELSTFRYDVTIWRSARPRRETTRWRGWSEIGSLDALQRELTVDRPPTVAFDRVPNARSFGGAGPSRPGSDTRAAPVDGGVDPDAIRSVGEAAGYDTQLSWATGDPEGRFAVHLTRRDLAERTGVPDWPVAVAQPMANEPLLGLADRRLADHVSSALEKCLPRYMLPASISVMRELPLTPNGKVDRSALPAVDASSLRGREPRTPREKLIADAWREVLGGSEPSVYDDFFEVGGTSLMAIRLSVALRRRSLVVSPQEIFGARTIEAIDDLLDAASDAGTSVEVPDAGEDVARDDDRDVDAHAPRVGWDRWPDHRHLLLTGATGMLGIHLLDDVLRHAPDLHITCLVRGRTNSEARARLLDQYDWYFPGSELRGELDERVDVLSGDLTRPGLGLGDGDTAHLVGSVDVVLHCAADVRHVAGDDEVFATNVGGTERIIELCRAVGDVELVHISTIGVAGRSTLDDPPPFSEQMVNVGQTTTEAYSESKLRSEALVREYVGETGRGSIMRVGTVAPNWSTGRFQRNIDDHFFGRHLRGAIRLGVAADWPGRRLGLVPVDRMARAVLLLSGQDAAQGMAFHLDSPHKVTYGDLHDALIALGYEIDIQDADTAVERILALADDEVASEEVGRVLPLILPRQGTATPLDSDTTIRWLDALGFEYPRPELPWIARLVRHAVDVGYFPEPRGGVVDAATADGMGGPAA
ncbi:MAG: amino acid adenylation domain-containing protein [Actinomycetota bacterium]